MALARVEPCIHATDTLFNIIYIMRSRVVAAKFRCPLRPPRTFAAKSRDLMTRRSTNNRSVMSKSDILGGNCDPPGNLRLREDLDPLRMNHVEEFQ